MVQTNHRHPHAPAGEHIRTTTPSGPSTIPCDLGHKPENRDREMLDDDGGGRGSRVCDSDCCDNEGDGVESGGDESVDGEVSGFDEVCGGEHGGRGRGDEGDDGRDGGGSLGGGNGDGVEGCIGEVGGDVRGGCSCGDGGGWSGDNGVLVALIVVKVAAVMFIIFASDYLYPSLLLSELDSLPE
ncbi:hypothetical protein QAD02_013187 [Eretmocerus hayati]|uniref:Uncharacterized protein n=1 Tax=Eretmocerus hayati TaxID=131215 RepID=A0ACC2P6I5_9HYME|nr:hypothetical protein QAD02_013187 [Eretmocerus hayati]